MCCPTGDGAAAAIVCSEEMVKKFGRKAVKVACSVLTSDPWTPRDLTMPDVNTLTRNAAKIAYAKAGIGPEDLDLVECHDCFATAELLHKFSGKYLCGQHAWILGARISCNPDYPGLVKSRRAKLLEEGTAFLCAGDSGKPAARIFEDLCRERLPQY